MKRFLILFAVLMYVSHAQAKDTTQSSIERGRQFLADLYDPELRLLPEFDGHHVYWLFHDNYLAAKVLEKSHPELASEIRSGIAAHGVEHSGKIEILYGESPDPLPFRRYELAEVARSTGKVINTERVVGEAFAGWAEYADLLFLAAIALAESDPTAAKQHLDAGLAMWDGIGLRDRVVDVNERYATYKLALAIIAADRVGAENPAEDAMLTRLHKLQADSGGWITDYKPDGTPIGFANVETTCMAILALESAE